MSAVETRAALVALLRSQRGAQRGRGKREGYSAVARRAGMWPSEVNRIANGKRTPQPATVARLVAVLDAGGVR